MQPAYPGPTPKACVLCLPDAIGYMLGPGLQAPLIRILVIPRVSDALNYPRTKIRVHIVSHNKVEGPRLGPHGDNYCDL
jgi:hypothetical protein